MWFAIYYFIGLIVSTPLVYFLFREEKNNSLHKDDYSFSVALILIATTVWPIALVLALIIGLLKFCEKIWGNKNGRK